MDGVFLFNKPIAWTSHDLVDAARRRFGTRRVGHAGTLDPMATGLMILLVGKATSRSSEFMGMDKTYRGSIRLGVQTDSWDADGKILEEKAVGELFESRIKEVFSEFEGEVSLTPPIFSAIRHGGKKAYALARRNEPVALQARKSKIYEFKLEAWEAPEIYFELSCSKGTYVRSVANVIGQKLGCGASLSSLVRTRIGNFYLKDAQSLEDFR